MRRLAIGDEAPRIELPTAAGGRFNSRALRGRRWLLGIHRYAT